MNAKRWVGSLALNLAMLAGASAPALAQDASYPSRSVTLVVPLAPGGMTDALGRLLSQHMTTTFGQPVVVDNRPGGGGMIGTAAVGRAAPDGYTALVTITSHIQNPFLYPEQPFDAMKDFTAVSQLAQSQLGLVVTPDVPVQDAKGLVAEVKSKPGTYNFSSFGNATTGHIYGEKFSSDNALDMIHVPYKGAGPQLTALLGGHVKVGWIDIGTARPHLETGKLRMLAVIGTQRAPLFPDVPTLAEAGFPGYEAAGWLGVLLPAQTPAPVVEKFGAEIQRIVALPEIQTRLKDLALVPVGNSPAEFAEVLVRDSATWGEIIKKHNISAN